MVMSNILVEWEGESPKVFSVCKRSDIADGELRNPGVDLIGKVVQIQWKTREYPGRILQLGSEDDLEKKADELATEELMKETPKKKARRDHRAETDETSKKLVKDTLTKIARVERGKNGRKSGNLKSSVAEVLANLPEENGPLSPAGNYEIGHDDASGTNDSKETADNSYKAKYKALRKKYRELKSKYKSLSEDMNSEQLVELVSGSGVRIKNSDLEKMKLVSNQVTILARNLFRYFFTADELSTHSLFGKQCNANKKESIPLPSIDGVRRDAIIKFILKENGVDESACAANKELNLKRKAVKREVTKTLSDFLREEHRKANISKN